MVGLCETRLAHSPTICYFNDTWSSLGKSMIKREYWLGKIATAWEKRSVIWLPGVRRAGKTSICKDIPGIEYFDCELPRIRRMMADPEAFLNDLRGKCIALDEIHRLEKPSELLKIAADHYSDIRVIATGSSTLSASKKFSDTLTGRKKKIWLTPMLYDESELFGNNNLQHRFLHGGLPPFFRDSELPEEEFTEWLEDYWAKDIQELFRIENKHSFQRFVELILANSGNIFEATKFATPCEVSRGTISKYLHILNTTFVAHIIKPYSSHAAREITSAPKVYGFDTGFVCHYRGWINLRPEDLGNLWEHVVLNELQAKLSKSRIRYWRDKDKNEIDFIYLKTASANPQAIECKWSANHINTKNFHRFRSLYPDGENYVVAADIDRPYTINSDGLTVNCINLKGLIEALTHKNLAQ